MHQRGQRGPTSTPWPSRQLSPQHHHMPAPRALREKLCEGAQTRLAARHLQAAPRPLCSAPSATTSEAPGEGNAARADSDHSKHQSTHLQTRLGAALVAPAGFPPQRLRAPTQKALILSRVARTRCSEPPAPVQEMPGRKHCPRNTWLGPRWHQAEAPHLGLFSCDAVNGKPALGIIHQAEVLARLLDADDI